MSKRVAVITGANGGLGLRASLELAHKGLHVVLACRNMERARQALDAVRLDVPGAELTSIELDVSEPESIHAFGKRFASQFGRVDVLINNAGVVLAPFGRNSVGHELHLATNWLGPFALTGTLLPLFRESSRSRIVNVGSLSHRFVRVDLEDPNWERKRYGAWRAYGRSKLYLQSFTAELDRRLRLAGREPIAVGAHPGFADTGARMNVPGMRSETGWVHDFLERVIGPAIPKAADATRPIIHAATDEDVEGGAYHGPTGILEIRGATGPARVNPIARDVATGRRLWALAEEMTGVRYLGAS